MTNLDKIVRMFALPIIISAGILLVLISVLSIKSTNTRNNAYIQVINCIISIPATTRTRADIDQCYNTIEHNSHVKLQRYNRYKN